MKRLTITIEIRTAIDNSELYKIGRDAMIKITHHDLKGHQYTRYVEVVEVEKGDAWTNEY